MALTESMIGLLQFRIAQEELSSRIYHSMSVWLEFNGFTGAAKLWKTYSDEELKHANWAYQFLQDLNIKPVVPSIEKPISDFKGLPNIIALSFQHEEKISNQCKDLARAAMELQEPMVLELALRYNKEQVEEMGKMQYWVDRLQAFGIDPAALRLLDNEMGG